MSIDNEELRRRLRKLRPSPPPRPESPISELKPQLQNEIIISTKFLKSMFGRPSNFVFSPSVILQSLSTVLKAASQNTKNEFEKVFGKTFDFDDAYIKDLITCHYLCYSKKFSLDPTFVNNFEQMNNLLLAVDFEDEVTVAKEINSKVSKKFGEKISKFIDNHHINKDSSLYLGSVTTLTENWYFSFEKPKSSIFYSDPPRQIDMVHQRAGVPWHYSEGETWTCLGIPYMDHLKKFYIVLPKERNGLQNLIEQLDSSMIYQFLRKGDDSVKARATIPIFEVQSNLVLNDLLMNEGITEIFEKSSLNKIVSDYPSLGLDTIVHTARFKVDQYGADGKIIKDDGLRVQRYYEHVDFVADHPFMFLMASWEQYDNKLKLMDINFVGTFI